MPVEVREVAYRSAIPGCCRVGIFSASVLMEDRQGEILSQSCYKFYRVCLKYRWVGLLLLMTMKMDDVMKDMARMNLWKESALESLE